MADFFVVPTYGMEYPDDVQTYLDASPITWQEFLQHPIQTIGKWIYNGIFQQGEMLFRTTKKLFGMLLCAAAFRFLIAGDRWDTLLEWIFACACFLLAEDILMEQSQVIAEKSAVWKDFLYSFTPVFATSMAVSGQVTSATVCNGFFLTAISWVAGILQNAILPMTELFLAITAAGIFSEHATAKNMSLRLGRMLRRIVSWIGVGFTALMGIQRVFSGVTDNAALQTGKSFFYSSIPIVGQAIFSAAGGILAGMKLVQSGLGFAAIAIVGAECIPLYVQTMLCWFIFTLVAMAASLLGLQRCADMMDGLAAGVYVLAAILALYFGMLAVGILMMLILGGARI